MRMAYDMLYLPIHLIRSALGQKVEAKPMGSSPRERCQGRAVMSDREVAGLAGVMGLPMGLNSGRVSPFRTKSGREFTGAGAGFEGWLLHPVTLASEVYSERTLQIRSAGNSRRP